MELLLMGVIGVAIVVILYLLSQLAKLKNNLSSLQKINNEKQTIIEHLRKKHRTIVLPQDFIDTHDRVIEMFEAGKEVELISKELKIPQSKVEMTLRFEKIRHNGGE